LRVQIDAIGFGCEAKHVFRVDFSIHLIGFIDEGAPAEAFDQGCANVGDGEIGVESFLELKRSCGSVGDLQFEMEEFSDSYEIAKVGIETECELDDVVDGFG